MELSTLPQQLINGILLGSIYALIALGYTMVYGVLKLINFAHGEVFMMGAYAALFASWALGYTPNNALTGSNPVNLIVMLLASMTFCGLLGVFIERFAYRPLRTQPRIASLITAIGISLFLQYGGQLFLPSSPAPNIDGKVNPFIGNLEVTLAKGAGTSAAAAADIQSKAAVAQKSYDDWKLSHKGADEFNLPADGQALLNVKHDTDRAVRDLKDRGDSGSLKLSVPRGQFIMLVTTVILMGMLTYLVMFTKQGRAMRAVSHDFDAAALMGVNVNGIVTFTFLVGSALAGAGAMMSATFLSGTKIDTFFGMLPGVKAFVAAVLGGIGNIPGAVLGGLLMGVAETLVVWLGYDNYRDAIAFVVLIIVLLVRPGGLLGSSKVEKV